MEIYSGLIFLICTISATLMVVALAILLWCVANKLHTHRRQGSNAQPGATLFSDLNNEDIALLIGIGAVGLAFILLTLPGLESYYYSQTTPGALHKISEYVFDGASDGFDLLGDGANTLWNLLPKRRTFLGRLGEGAGTALKVIPNVLTVGTTLLKVISWLVGTILSILFGLIGYFIVPLGIAIVVHWDKVTSYWPNFLNALSSGTASGATQAVACPNALEIEALRTAVDRLSNLDIISYKHDTSGRLDTISKQLTKILDRLALLEKKTT